MNPRHPRRLRENWDRFLKLPIPPNGKSHAQIAKVVGCTKQRISQIETQALKKLFRLAQALRNFRDEEKSNI